MYFTRFQFTRFMLWMEKWSFAACIGSIFFDMLFWAQNQTGLLWFRGITLVLFLFSMVYELCFLKCPHCKKRIVPDDFRRMKEFSCPHCHWDQF